MKVSIQLERLFYNYIRKNPELYKNVKSNYFSNDELSYIYKIEKDFYEKYNTIPTTSQLKDSFLIDYNKNTNIDEEELESYLNIIETISNINLDDYDQNWLKKTIEAFFYWKTLDNSMFDAINFMKSSEVNTNTVLDIVEKVKNIIIERNSFSLDFNQGLDFLNYESHIQIKEETFSTGYKFLDLCLSGGYKKKTLVTLLGRQKSGKSLWMSNLASEIIKLGKNVAFITLEMSEKSVIKRISSNLLNINISEFDEISRNEILMKNKLMKFKKKYESSLLGLGSLFIKEFPTSSASTIDIENYVKKLEEVNKLKIDLLVVDYINIMKNWRNANSENTYLKIKTIAEDLRAIAVRNDLTILTATQTIRKNGVTSDLQAEDVSESIGLISTVDALFGIIQDEQMRADEKYILKALALRDSGYVNERQHFTVDYNFMRIKEDATQSHYNTDSIFKKQQKTEDIIKF